jgi:hypothetical protein
MDNYMQVAAVWHKDINNWRETVKWVRDEVVILESQLEAIATGQQEVEIMQHVQQFESRFIRQREVVDEWEHELKLADHQVRIWIERTAAGEQVMAPDHAAFGSSEQKSIVTCRYYW